MDTASDTPDSRPEVMDIDAAAALWMRREAGAQNLNQSQLARASGVTISTLNRYWNEERSMRLGDLNRIIRGLGFAPGKAMDQIDRIQFGLDQ